MEELFGCLLFAALTAVVFIALPFGANNVGIAEIRAAEEHCASHGGIKRIDNDYLQEVVCEDGLSANMKWVVEKYATP